MRLFLIRHAETVHNLGQIWAGTTDSPLTNHGVLQIQRLAEFFVSRAVRFTHVFASDLSRARLTAEGICRSQNHQYSPVTTIVTEDLREKHFGDREGVKWNSTSSSSSSADSESEASMKARASSFLSAYIIPLLLDNQGRREEAVVAVVAHGLILRVLWGCLLRLFDPRRVSSRGHASWNHPIWSNTGFLEVRIEFPSVPLELSSTTTTTLTVPLEGWSMDILAVDSKEHLAHLRRTRGIGSSEYDRRQRRIDSFFGSMNMR